MSDTESEYEQPPPVKKSRRGGGKAKASVFPGYVIHPDKGLHFGVTVISTTKEGDAIAYVDAMNQVVALGGFIRELPTEISGSDVDRVGEILGTFLENEYRTCDFVKDTLANKELNEVMHFIGPEVAAAVISMEFQGAACPLSGGWILLVDAENLPKERFKAPKVRAQNTQRYDSMQDALAEMTTNLSKTQNDRLKKLVEE